MKIKKGDILRINHARKGVFVAKALEDFDTNEKEFYPVIALERVYGASCYWLEGEKIPCRASFCSINKESNNDN